ncbi:MAG: hypothetical protein EOP18_05160 [Rhizobiaceae bacterium]|nr:MAG: hypothetical protein EOP18_05160 [Rhizobiaceae bacterium]
MLFTRLVVTAKSIQVLTPTLGPNTHVDFSAVASIVRNLAECYLFFFFLCIDDVPQDQKDARIILLNLHDDGSRAKLFAELGEKGIKLSTPIDWLSIALTAYGLYFAFTGNARDWFAGRRSF